MRSAKFLAWMTNAVIAKQLLLIVIVVGGYGDTCGNGCRYSVEHFKIHKRDLFMGRKVKPWSYKADPLNENFVVFDKREHCCISSFKQNYMIGGWKPYQYLNNEFINSCFVYNLKLDRWSQIADMNKKRGDAACTVLKVKLLCLVVGILESIP